MHLFQENTPKDLKSALETLAILDVGPFLDGQYSALDRLALEIRYACETIGFFYIKNHGIANPVIEEAFAQSRRFHDLPLSKKQNVPLDKHNVGYLPMNKSVQTHSTVHKATKPNQNESFFTKNPIFKFTRERRCQNGKFATVGVNNQPHSPSTFVKITYSFHIQSIGKRKSIKI